MADTFIDQIIEYPVKAIQKIGSNSDIVSLLTNNPHIDMESDEADSVFDKYLFTYSYVDSTTTSSEAYVCVEAEIITSGTPTIQDIRLYAKVICHKSFMAIDPSKFRLSGNRRDNLIRFVDNVLNGEDIAGIGNLVLDRVATVQAPAGFTARELTYKISAFKTRRN